MVKRICILGGSGYIGTKLASVLSDDLTIVDRNEYLGDRNVSFIKLTALNYIKSTDFSQFDVVVLLSGQCSVVSSCDLKVTMENNVTVFCNLVSKLTKDQVFIYASSSSVYGNTDAQEVDETYNKYTPYNYYDLSKQTIDNIAKLTDLNYYGLRFGTVSGYSENMRNDLMINSMWTSAINNGCVYVSNGCINRPVLSIRDLVKSIKTIIGSAEYSKRGVYNLVSFNSTVMELANKVAEYTGCLVNEIDQESHRQKEVNFKLTSKTYDFRITQNKFEREFGKKSMDTVYDIMMDLETNIPKCRGISNRLEVYRDYVIVDECFVCGNKLRKLLDLGTQPLANEYTTGIASNIVQDSFPLELSRCDDCTHTQLNCVVNPSKLFDNYLYVSGTSGTLKRYFQEFADNVIERYELTCNSSVLDIACNDGSQLDCFPNQRTFGVDPAKNVTKGITRHKISNRYFGTEDIIGIKKELGEKSFDIIIAQNVFAHTSKVNEFLQSVNSSSDENTVLLIQTSQAYMIADNEYDSVYHEHLSFFNTLSMKTACERNGLLLRRVDIPNIHGGSYLFTITRRNNIREIKDNISETMDYEKGLGLYGRLEDYVTNVKMGALQTHIKLLEYKSRGYKLVGFGSTAKSNTMLNYIGADGLFDCIIDENPSKVGKFTPGLSIPVVSMESVKYNSNTLFVVLAWNFFDEIKQKLRDRFGLCQVVNLKSLYSKSTPSLLPLGPEFVDVDLELGFVHQL
jgi:nucleoside-diphosphate-sugar epimerase/cyclopropane fatty-acyl-phospholipid synthase-like methyltransferase